MSTINITAIEDNVILACSPGNASYAPSYWENADLVMDEAGNVRVETATDYGSSCTTEDRWLNRELAWSLASSRGGALKIDTDRLRADLAPGGPLHALLERVHAGHSIDWDGSYYVGRLTDDAMEAKDEIEYSMGCNFVDDSASIWVAQEWAWDQANDEISAETTDEKLAEMVKEYSETAERDGITIVGEFADVFREIRENKRADEA